MELNIRIVENEVIEIDSEIVKTNNLNEFDEETRDQVIIDILSNFDKFTRVTLYLIRINKFGVAYYYTLLATRIRDDLFFTEYTARAEYEDLKSVEPTTAVITEETLRDITERFVEFQELEIPQTEDYDYIIFADSSIPLPTAKPDEFDKDKDFIVIITDDVDENTLLIKNTNLTDDLKEELIEYYNDFNDDVAKEYIKIIKQSQNVKELLESFQKSYLVF